MLEKKQGTYRSGSALRTALEERLKQIADKERLDLQRLRRQVAFDRLLSRLLDPDRSDWVLKGGSSMELRFRRARAARDLDFTVASRPAGDGDTLLDYLQTHAAVEAMFDRYDITDERDIQTAGEKLARYLEGKAEVVTKEVTTPGNGLSGKSREVQ